MAWHRPTFYRIYKNKSTEGFQSMPYVAALFSAMLWIYYALLKSDECLLITVNSAGCVIETLYIVVYLAYAPKKARLFTAKILLLVNVGVFGLILLLTLLLAAGQNRVVLLGWVCVGFSVSVFVAPLSIIVRTAQHLYIYTVHRQVVRTRSVEFMPFTLSLSLTVSAVVWFLYGLLVKDKYVAVSSFNSSSIATYASFVSRKSKKRLPNVLGFTFGVIQMGLYALYRNAATPRVPAKEASVDDTFKVAEHVVTIDKLSSPASEQKAPPPPPPPPPTEEAMAKQENDKAAPAAPAKEEDPQGKKVDNMGSNADLQSG
ncbi:hypothetical protein U9M48_002251 [Paspalum notatum var. saurae]|uniref:Bidirectional sugar transporter SWEET n=1 Tax=Paspalum notatum var. saurae TaxID=547442 RepID=A0AAQ3PQI7_PASNO